MLAAYLTGALIAAAALASGQAVMALCGREKASPLAPALGLALLVIVANLAIKLPGRATTAWIALAVLVLASAAVLVARRRAGRLGVFVWPAVLAALIAAFCVSIPFLVNGRVGPLGQGLINDDMASHLLFTDWVATHAGRTPDLISEYRELVAKLGSAYRRHIASEDTILVELGRRVLSEAELETIQTEMRARRR